MTVVPAIYNETEEERTKAPTEWIKDVNIHRKYNITVARYQRIYPDQPNYVNNQGTEGGVYLRYIVDHYNDFPDIAVFVHAFPHVDRGSKWPEILGCIRQNASFIHINPRAFHMRDTHFKGW